MEDKFFDLLEKVYMELQETKKDLKNDIKGLTNRIDNNEANAEKRFDELTEHIDKVETNTDKRFNELTEHIDKVETNTDKRFNELTEHIDKVETNTDKRFNELTERIDKVETNTDKRFNELMERMVKTEINIENIITRKINVLFDAQTGTNERLDRIEGKLEDVSQKVNNHDFRIQILESKIRNK